MSSTAFIAKSQEFFPIVDNIMHHSTLLPKKTGGSESGITLQSSVKPIRSIFHIIEARVERPILVETEKEVCQSIKDYT